MHHLEESNNIADAFYRMAESYGSLLLYEQAVLDPQQDSPDVPRPWEGRTFGEVSERVLKLASYLQSLGCGKEAKIAIISQSRPEWLESDLAILSVGGVSVSVYQSLPYDDIGYILFDSGADVVFAENQEQVDKLLYLLQHEIDIPGTDDRDAQKTTLTLKKVICFEEVEPASHQDIFVQYEDVLGDTEAGEIPEIVKTLTREDLASFVYTSGTTGPPKGVVQTHGNHMANCRQAVNARILTDECSIMVFLPLAHSFAKLMGLLGALTTASLKFPAVPCKKTSKLDPASVTKDIREAGANVIPIVPRLLEKMQAGVQAQKSQKAILRMTLDYAKRIYEAEEQGRSGSIVEQIMHQGLGIIRKAVKKKLFGSELQYLVSGGAKLNTDVARFFDMLGIEILEGYGLTETCVATNINRLGHKKIGSVGPVLDDDIEMRIAEDGEILYRGPNVAKGYYNRPTATKESWDDDGWFHTGDLGEVDEEGFLSIVGRKKDIIVTSYGKNVAPDGVEGVLKSSPFISQAVLVGDARAYCVTLLTLDEAAVKSWASKEGVSLQSSLSQDEQVKALIQKELERLSETLASHETPKKFDILPEDLTVENGFLTPTFKVKKKAVMQSFQKNIDALYDA